MSRRLTMWLPVVLMAGGLPGTGGCARRGETSSINAGTGRPTVRHANCETGLEEAERALNDSQVATLLQRNGLVVSLDGDGPIDGYPYAVSRVTSGTTALQNDADVWRRYQQFVQDYADATGRCYEADLFAVSLKNEAAEEGALLEIDVGSCEVRWIGVQDSIASLLREAHTCRGGDCVAFERKLSDGEIASVMKDIRARMLKAFPRSKPRMSIRELEVEVDEIPIPVEVSKGETKWADVNVTITLQESDPTKICAEVQPKMRRPREVERRYARYLLTDGLDQDHSLLKLPRAANKNGKKKQDS